MRRSSSASVSEPVIGRFKRVMLLLIIAISLLSTISGWAVMGARGTLTPALQWVQLVTMGVLSTLLVVAWRRLASQRAIELACLLYAATICAVCMALAMYWPSYGKGIHLQPLYLWIPVVYVFAFTLTNHKIGLLISLGIWLLFAVVSLPYLVSGAEAGYENLTIQLHFVSAVLVTALYYFSSYQYRLAFAQHSVNRLEKISNTDALTGLFNRRRMAATITNELSRLQTTENTFAVMLLDVDHFKKINDDLGHGVGDQVLVAFAERAARVLRGAGALGRWGGDEFVAVVRDMDIAGAESLAETLRASVVEEPLLGDRHTTISCGVALAEVGDDIDSVLLRADAALYSAKRAGRNRVGGVLRRA